MKNIIVDGILIEDMNWNTLKRLISNKKTIKLPVKVFNSVAFKNRTLGSKQIYKSCNFFVIFT